MRPTFLAVALLLAAASNGCDGLAPTDAESPILAESTAAKALVQKDVLYAEWTAIEDEIFLDCLNDGAGETADYVGSGEIVGHAVTTPNGAVLWNATVSEWDVSYTGQTTGVVFEGGGQGRMMLHFKADGNIVVSEPVLEELEEVGGNRILRTLTQWVGSTNNGKPGTFDLRITSCTLN